MPQDNTQKPKCQVEGCERCQDGERGAPGRRTYRTPPTLLAWSGLTPPILLVTPPFNPPTFAGYGYYAKEFTKVGDSVIVTTNKTV